MKTLECKSYFVTPLSLAANTASDILLRVFARLLVEFIKQLFLSNLVCCVHYDAENQLNSHHQAGISLF